MTDKNRTRYVQKEALYEVLQESVKDKKLDKNSLDVLHQLAQELEDQVFQVSNQDINKDYRQRINTIKVRLKGEKGALLRTVLIDRLLTPKQIMQMDMNTLNEEHIIEQLGKQGINLTKSQILQSPQKSTAIKNPIPHSSVQLKQVKKMEEQMNDYEAVSAIKEKYEQIAEQTPTLLENQQGEFVESQSQINFFLDALDNRPQQQQENKEDEVEQYEPILNTQINQEQVQRNNNVLEEEQFFDQVAEKLNQAQQQEPLPSDDRMNQDIIQDDIDVSQSKLCASLLKNIYDKPEQEQVDNEVITKLYSEVEQLRLKNKELTIQSEFYLQEQKRLKQQHSKELEKQQVLFQTEIQQLKAQLDLAKNALRHSESNNILMKSFNERQQILQNIMNQIMNNIHSSQEQPTIKRNQKPSLSENLFVDEKPNKMEQISNPIVIPNPQQSINSENSQEKIQYKSQNENLSEKQQNNRNIPQLKRQAHPPPPPQTKKVVHQQEESSQQQKNAKIIEQQPIIQKEPIKIQEQVQFNQEENITEQNAEEFFNQLSNQNFSIQGPTSEEKKREEIFENCSNIQFATKEEEIESEQQLLINLSQQAKVEEQAANVFQVKHEEPQTNVFQQNPFEDQQKVQQKAHRPAPKPRRVIPGSIQNVPSSLFD